MIRKGFSQMTLAFLAVAVIQNIGCEPLSRSRRVVGGHMLAKGADPWLVSLWYMPTNFFTEKTGLHHVCGAAIISPKYLLTAAQCFEKLLIPGLEDVSNWKVVAGLYSQEEANSPHVEFRKIAKVIRNPNWNPSTGLGDIAILELDKPLTMTQWVGEISYKDDGCVKPGMTCAVAGWGQRSEAKKNIGSVLPYVTNVPIVSLKTCKAAMAPSNTGGVPFSINDSILCAGAKGHDACAGDAGSPLVCECNGKKVIAGVVSTGLGCAREGFYGIYSNVEYYEGWIKSVIGG